MRLDPGFIVGMPAAHAEQTLERLYVTDGGGADWWPSGDRTPVDRLDPVTASELVRDLTELTG